MSPALTTALLTINLAGLIALALAHYKSTQHYKLLTKNTNKQDLKGILEEHLQKIAKLSRKVDQLENLAMEIKTDNQLHIQKVGLIRFNPFQEVGGDQSFALALLDNDNTGVVISSLYSREGTRIFGKIVKEGQADKHKFSQEEIEAIKKACG